MVELVKISASGQSKTLRYSETEEDRRLAILHTAQYLGYHKFKMLARYIQIGLDKEIDSGEVTEEQGLRRLHFILSISGVQGFPVHEMIRRYRDKPIRGGQWAC